MVFVLVVAIFIYWSLVGAAILQAISRFFHLDTSAKVSLSPALGLVASLLVASVFSITFNQPIREFGPLLILGLFVGSLAVLRAKPLSLSLKSLVVPIVSLSAVLPIGLGLLIGGTKWLGYGNEDSAHFVLAATRLLHGGFFEAQNHEALLSGRDYSQGYWAWHVLIGHRPGSDVYLALVSSVTSMAPQQVYMILILALHAVMAVAASLLIWMNNEPSLKFQGLTSFLVAVSPLTVFGVTNQLIGQVGGVAILTALFGISQILLNQLRIRNLSMKFRQITSWIPLATIFAVLLVGLALWYPEVIPFGFVALAIQIVIFLKRFSSARRQTVAISIAGIAVTVLFLLLTDSLLRTIRFTVGTLTAGTAAVSPGDEIFPYFLIPSGLLSLVGWVPFAAPRQWLFFQIAPLWMNPLLVGAIVTIIVVTYLAVRHVAKGSLAASGLLTGLALQLWFVLNANGFAAFKMPMFFQPFWWTTLVITAITVQKERLRQIAIGSIISLSAMALPTTFYFVRASLPNSGYSINVASAVTPTSLNGLDERLRLIRDSESEEKRVVFLDDSPYISLMLAARARGVPLNFGEFQFIVGKESGSIREATSSFGEHTVRFQAPAEMGRGDVVLFAPSRSVINSSTSERSRFHEAHEPRLVFVPSDLGPWWYRSGPGGSNYENSAFYGVENDPIDGDRTIQAFGRYALFRIQNYEPGLALRLSVTSSFLPQQNFALNSVRVIGNGEAMVNFVGFGAGVGVSEQISPKFVDGEPYVLLDFGRDPAYFPNRRSLLLNLYGSSFREDRRKIAMYVRDLSLVKIQSKFQGGIPGTSDVAPQVTSGMFEDGWLSSHSRFVPEVNNPQTFRLRGSVHPNAIGKTVRVLQGGRVCASMKPRTEIFEISCKLIPSMTSNLDVTVEPTPELDNGRPLFLFVEEALFR